jgi:hypothetical protein
LNTGELVILTGSSYYAIPLRIRSIKEAAMEKQGVTQDDNKTDLQKEAQAGKEQPRPVKCGEDLADEMAEKAAEKKSKNR